jgi:hypothetical protein
MPKHVYTVKLGDLAEVPGSPYAYWAPKTLRELFQKYPPLDRDVAGQKDKPKIADVKQGLSTADDLRFTRFWWEVDTNNIATSREETYHKKWVPFAKGGKPFYHDMQVVVNWLNDGEEIRNFEKAVIRNEDFYFREGLAWLDKLSWTVTGTPERFKVFCMPESTIFSQVTYSGFIGGDNVWPLLAFLRSQFGCVLYSIMDPNIQHTLVGNVAKLPINPGIFDSKIFAIYTKEAHAFLREWDTGNEPSTQFVMPWLLQVWSGFSHDWKPVTNHPLAKDFQWTNFKSANEVWGEDKQWNNEASIIALANECVKRERKLRKRLDEIQNAIDDEVYRIYDISEEDRRLIEEELTTVEHEEGKAEAKEKKHDNLMPAAEYIKRLLSYSRMK